MNRSICLSFVFALLTLNASAQELSPLAGVGWTMTRLDMEVRIERDEPALTVTGEMALRLDLQKSPGPTLWFNSREPAMKWDRLEGEAVARVEFGSVEHLHDAVRYAAVELAEEAAQGDEITLEFTASKIEDSWQLVTMEDIAIGSWVDVWYPVTLSSNNLERLFSSRMISIPGTTTLNLPDSWIGISDGHLVSRIRHGGRTIEVWKQGKKPVARSFAAGPYTSAVRTVDDRAIQIYLLEDHVLDADRLAAILAATMAAQENRLGPFPFPGYGVVEVPEKVASWGAASQQTFIMAKSENFDYDHGNLPLWAHEMSHGWWGNTVGSTGPGYKIAGESLAQFGVLIAIEALEDADSVAEFLDYSRTGYNPMQCARGYFQMIEEGHDHPLAALGDSELSGGQTHNLADSKGLWVYHMLRRHVGDEIFFDTLRGLIDEFADKEMSLDDIRAAFQKSAPDAGLDRFFEQWLDRTGAPAIEASWTRLDDARFEVTFSQIQESDPFTLDLEFDLVLEDGTVHRETISIDGRETKAALELPAEVASITLDPDHDVLIWRPGFAAGPVVDGTALLPTADWVDPTAYVGTFHVEAFEQTVEVFSKEGGLWVRIGEMLRQIYPHEPHRFVTLNGVSAEFDLENGVATGFAVTLPNGNVGEGVRVE